MLGYCDAAKPASWAPVIESSKIDVGKHETNGATDLSEHEFCSLAAFALKYVHVALLQQKGD